MSGGGNSATSNPWAWGYGWTPPSQNLPPNTTTSYPQLAGGPWNQLTQLMAGPNYSTAAPKPTVPADPRPGFHLGNFPAGYR